jgi:hypothetical protein
MAWYWWIVLVGAVWLFWRRRGRQHVAEVGIANARPWLLEQGFVPDTVQYSSYKSDMIGQLDGSTMLAGVGNCEDGKTRGFAIELLPDGMVVDSALLHPGPASNHRGAAFDAKMNQTSFMAEMRKRNKLVDGRTGPV